MSGRASCSIFFYSSVSTGGAGCRAAGTADRYPGLDPLAGVSISPSAFGTGPVFRRTQVFSPFHLLPPLVALHVELFHLISSTSDAYHMRAWNVTP
jgi:hypothetical protein